MPQVSRVIPIEASFRSFGHAHRNLWYVMYMLYVHGTYVHMYVHAVCTWYVHVRMFYALVCTCTCFMLYVHMVRMYMYVCVHGIYMYIMFHAVCTCTYVCFMLYVHGICVHVCMFCAVYTWYVHVCMFHAVCTWYCRDANTSGLSGYIDWSYVHGIVGMLVLVATLTGPMYMVL